MTSAILFAPQVQSIQPAFVYDTEVKNGIVKINFSLSDYNTQNDFNCIEYKVIDPTVSSGWGESIIKTERLLSNDLEFNISFENILLELNKFYEVQIRLIASDNEEESYSDWSQITLIRPISEVQKIIIEETTKENYIIPEWITGKIIYKDGSTIEQIAEVKIRINNSSQEEVYNSEYISNTLGTNFKINISNCFLSTGNYKLYLDYKTINGYNVVDENGQDLIIKSVTTETNGLSLSQIIMTKDEDGGAIDFIFSFSGDNILKSGILKIFRSDAIHEFLNWRILSAVKMKDLSAHAIKWKDYSTEGGQVYQYKFIYETEDGYSYLVDRYQGEPLETVIEFEDIFLSDKNAQLAIRYNSNISNFKWITQESLTNTLGGKFPIVRINGDTYYRQFSLSGTLSFFAETNFNDQSFDSINQDVSQWMRDTNESLFFDIDTAFKYLNSEQYSAYRRKPEVIEKKFRDIALAFLTNKNPKLFRSVTEGNMIVYLSGISFTPNRQLGRNIYDFSATVTEICEATYENMKKYHLNIPKDFNEYLYILEVEKIDAIESPDGFIYLTPYISAKNILNNYPIIKEVPKT